MVLCVAAFRLSWLTCWDWLHTQQFRFSTLSFLILFPLETILKSYELLISWTCFGKMSLIEHQCTFSNHLLVVVRLAPTVLLCLYWYFWSTSCLKGSTQIKVSYLHFVGFYSVLCVFLQGMSTLTIIYSCFGSRLVKPGCLCPAAFA